MNIKNLLLATLLASAAPIWAQQVINLPQPDLKAKSLSMIETLNTRHSVREYDKTPLTKQELSNLCWAACGVSRDKDHRTAPTARNRKEIRLYVFTKEGAYEYNAVENSLTLKAKGDHRKLIAGKPGGFSQDFVLDAPVSLLMVIDFKLLGGKDENAIMMGCVDAGNVSENINLYCQSVGLATVPRATHDKEGLIKLLGLNDMQLPIMNNPVGWPIK